MGFAFEKPQSDRVGNVSFGHWLRSVQKACSGAACEHFDVNGKGPGNVKEEAVKLLTDVHNKSLQANGIVEKQAMSELSGGVGGYLVPYEYAYGIMRDVAEDDDIFWPRAFVQPMGSKTMLMPLPDPTTSLGIQQKTNLIGGMQMFWRSTEGAGMAESEPTFNQVELTAEDLAGYQVASNQLAMDYAGLDAFLRQICARSVAWYTSQAFFRGAGSGQPMGIVNAPGTVTVSPRNTTAAVKQVDLSSMYGRLLPQSHKKAIWAMSPTAMISLGNAGLSAGTLAMLPGEDGSRGLLYGLPFYVTEKLPAVGTTGDILLFDPSLYIIGHRGLYIDYSDQAPVQFGQNQSVWRTVWRGDGVPMLDAAMTTANQSSTTVAMAVKLDTL